MTRRARVLPIVAGTIAAALLGAAPALAASSSYSCPLSGSTVCNSPLTGTVHGDVTVDVTVTDDGFYFNPSGNGAPGYVAVAQQIDMTHFPIVVSVEVKGVGVPSTNVGDYDVLRGTPAGNWKVEVLATSSRRTAQASCFFKGTNGKGTATGGPDLKTLQGVWTTITCTNTGSRIELRVNGNLVRTKAVSTGTIPNPGPNLAPLLIGAKNTNGGDQFSGYARSVQISVP